MFARVQVLHQPADKLDALTDAARSQLPALRELAGFNGCYYLIDRDNQKALVISLWETEQDLRQFEADTPARQRSAAQANIQPPPSEVFEVAFRAA